MKADKSKSKQELIRELESLRRKIREQEDFSKKNSTSTAGLDSEELTILLKAGMELGSTLNLGSIMQSSTDYITNLTNIGTAAIYLVKGNEIYLGATTPPLDPGMPDEFRWAKLSNHPHIKKAVTTRRNVYIADAHVEKLSPEETIIVEQRDLRSIWYIPVSIASGTIGVFIIASQGELRTCSKKEIDLCRALSNQVAIALQNSLLHKELEEKNEELSTTLLSIGDAVISTDINGNIVLMNPNAQKLCGYTFEEAKGKPLTDIFKIINSNTRKKVVDPVIKVISGGVRVNLANHTILVSKDGTEYQIADSASPIKDNNGEITGVVLVFSDVTQDYALREALRASEENLSKAELMGSFGNWEIDLGTNKIKGSHGAATIYGLKESEFELNTVQKIPIFKYRQLLDDSLKNLIQKNEPYDLEFEIKRPDGKIRVVHSTAKYDAKMHKVFGIIHDITERKLAEEALRASELKYKEFFMKDLTGDFLSTADGKVVECNPAFLSILGYSSLNEIQKLRADKFYVNPDVRKNFIELIKREREVRFYELNLVRSDGKIITVIENVVGIFDEKDNLTHLRGYLFDITNRKKAEEDIIEAKNKAEAADRMKTEFLAQMSHEIRSPLNAVLNFTSLVKDMTADNNSEDLDACFSGISSASKRIIRTVDSILNMSDLQLGTYQVSKRKLDIVEMLRNLVLEFENTVSGKRIDLRFVTNIQKKTMSIDDYALSQVIVNLLDNAIKFTREGYVEVKLEFIKGITISVKDTGIGIAKEYLPSLFTAFSQEEQGYTRSYEGNGLGLALVKKYCEILEANISVKSKKNSGTTFTITFKGR